MNKLLHDFRPGIVELRQQGLPRSGVIVASTLRNVTVPATSVPATCVPATFAAMVAAAAAAAAAAATAAAALAVLPPACPIVYSRMRNHNQPHAPCPNGCKHPQTKEPVKVRCGYHQVADCRKANQGNKSHTNVEATIISPSTTNHQRGGLGSLEGLFLFHFRLQTCL